MKTALLAGILLATPALAQNGAPFLTAHQSAEGALLFEPQERATVRLPPETLFCGQWLPGLKLLVTIAHWKNQDDYPACAATLDELFLQLNEKQPKFRLGPAPSEEPPAPPPLLTSL